MKAGVRIEEISMSYGGSRILDSVSLSIRKGSVVTMVGPNGCGKTTLLKIINRLLKPDRGQVYVDGRPVTSMPAHQLARIVGYVPQGHKTSFPFTVREVVVTGRMPYIPAFSSPRRNDLEKADQVLELTGIDRLADRAYTRISGGERQLVMIARALVQEPAVLLLDEPTSYLDFKNQVQTLKMIGEISRARGVTVIMTLHDPNHALMFSDDVVLLRRLCSVGDANVVASGLPHSVMTPENIRAAYGVEVETVEVRGRRLLMPL
ncbi:MAG: ABC transporter ATP-binding protein [Methanotrichaceae archaeon]|nr:ABC transporter ATP-binding protein [Methanotrichaceae archaeon]